MADIIVSSNVEKRKNESQHTRATKIEFNFTWKIDNFAFKASVLKNGEFLESDPFSADGSKDVQWQLLCFPKGDSRDLKGFGCFVEALKFCGPRLMMETNWGILDTYGTVMYKGRHRHTFTKFPDTQGSYNFNKIASTVS